MAVILVDYENVSCVDGLKGVEYLDERDMIVLFYSHCCPKIRADYIEMIEKSKCDFRTYKLVQSGKNALDFYIAVECGILCAMGAEQLIIVSRDKGFSAISDFFSAKTVDEPVAVHIATNVENALLASNASEDSERRQFIKNRTRALSIESECARIEAHRNFVNSIINAFAGTVYEGEINNILRFIENSDTKSPRSLYTSALHEFGREDGRAIYQRLKLVV